MKRILPLLLLFALLLGACTPSVGTETTPAATAAPTTAVETVATEPAATEPTEPAEPVWQPYTGKLRDYVYYNTEAWAVEWEEDILYVASVFLGEAFAHPHPYLYDGKLSTEFALDGLGPEFTSHYDAQKREEFLQDINDLIPRITQLQEYEIIFSLRKAVAKLGDLHSSVYPLWEYMYPVYLAPFYTDGEPALHIMLLPEKYEDLLYTRLVAINDIPVEEIITRLSDYISYENEPALITSVCDYICCSEMLAMCEVADYKEYNTRFTVMDGSGESHTFVLDAMTYYRATFSDYVGVFEEEAMPLLYRDPDVYYWWEYLEKEDILYVRFNEVKEDYYFNYSALASQLREQIKSRPAGQTVVMDFRDNPGGYFDANLAIKLASVLNMEQVKNAYVLIDGASFSGAIIMPGSIRELSEKAVLVGSPGGQPTNFFASNYTYTMPNSEHQFCMSDSWWITNAEDTGPALMPDVIIYQTLEDYLAGRDTVMEAILADEIR